MTTDVERRVDIPDQRMPQNKSIFHRLGGWFKRRFPTKRREQVVERNVEKERNELNVKSRKVMESGPLWQNTSAEVWGRESCTDSDGEADTTEQTNTDITSSMSSTTRLSGEGVIDVEVGKVLGSDGIYPNKGIAREEHVDEASERTTSLLTHRSLTKGNKLGRTEWHRIVRTGDGRLCRHTSCRFSRQRSVGLREAFGSGGSPGTR